jgi:transposase
MTPEEIQEIQNLSKQGLSVRAISKKLGRDRKTIRRILGRSSQPQRQPSKIAPFAETIRELAEKNLFAPRIMRELRARGYTGSITILKDFLRKIRGPKKEPPKIFRRFETPAAQEAQADWSLYRVPIAGTPTAVHCFSMILAYSRYLFVAFFRNERLPTLLHAHMEAFRFFQGLTHEIIYDNATTVTLGRVGGKPLWHPTFLDFARHMGFTPRVCRPYDPDRKGKVERPFFYLETDFLRGSEFSSWEDLVRRGREWLTTVANRRVHATTKRIPEEMFAEEKPLLIRLPEVEFATERREIRKVQMDGYISVDGSLYPVTGARPGQHVTAKVYLDRIQILDNAGKVLCAHPISDRPTRVAASGATPTPYNTAPASRPALEREFLAQFPDAAEFLDGLKRRMNLLTPIHLRQIQRLAKIYTEIAVRDALRHAQQYRNFSAVAVERILKSRYPNVIPEPPPTLIAGNPAALGALDDIDSGSPSDYTIDTIQPTVKKEDDEPKKRSDGTKRQAKSR